MNASKSVKLGLAMLLGLLVLSGGMCGCGSLSYVVQMLVPQGKGKWIEAQSEALSKGKKVLILVYADEAIQYRHGQLARYDTASMVAKEMQSQLEVDVVDPAAVEQFQASHLNWADRHPSQIGRERYGADLVLYIELEEFTTAAEESGELLRGNIRGNCSLYSTSGESEGGQLWHGKVKAAYPPDIPVMVEIGAVERIRSETIKLFAKRLVRHFYGHYEAD